MKTARALPVGLLTVCCGCATHFGVIIARSQAHVSSVPERKQFYVLPEDTAKEMFGRGLADAPRGKDRNIETKLSALPVLYADDMFAFPDGTHVFVTNCGAFYRPKRVTVFSAAAPLEIRLDCGSRQ